MRVLWTLLALVTLGAAPAYAQDPAVVDTDHYTVEFENDQVRVLRIRYGPGEESVMHDHPAGVVIFLSDLRGEFTMPDGEVVEMEGSDGQVLWTDATSHRPKNTSDGALEVIQIELKGAPAEASGE